MDDSINFLKGGGVITDLMLEKDWSGTTLGPLETWPENLKSAITLVINSVFPIAFYWGKDHLLFYNETWSVIAGNKHPQCLGEPAKVVWAEIWDQIEPNFNAVMNTGQTFRVPDSLFYMERFGYKEECYFDYSLSPIKSVNNTINGIFNAVIETSYKVISQRRDELIYKLLQNLNSSTSYQLSIEKLLYILNSGHRDIPLYALYIQKETGLELAFSSKNYNENSNLLANAQKLASNDLLFFDDISTIIPQPIFNNDGDQIQECMIANIQNGNSHIKGFLIAGLNPTKRKDQDYENFIKNIAIHIGTLLNNSKSLEKLEISKLRLEESEKRFRSMINQAPIAITVFKGKDLRIAHVNSTMLSLIRQDDSMIDKTFMHEMPYFNSEILVHEAKSVYNSGVSSAFKDYIINFSYKDQTITKYFDITFSPFYENEEITGVIQVTTNVTDQVLIEQDIARKNDELETLLEEYQFLANSVPSVVWTSKPNGELDYINDRWIDFTGRSIEDSLGVNWVSAVHPDDVEAAAAAWQKSISTGEPYQIEFRIKDKDNNYRWQLIKAIALKNEKGEVVKWYGSNTDIEDRKMLEKQKDNFLGVASHELKTPITSIKSYAQVMQKMFKSSGDEKNANLIAKIDFQINKLNHLVADLLDVTKINNGRLQFSNSKFNFTEMIDEIVEEVQHTTTKHQIIKKLDYDKNFEGDKDRIGQVITNLLTNAIKYSPTADKVIVFTESYMNGVKLCVQDFGIGIEKDVSNKVFEQFYRVSGTKEHTFPGLGLGLYICSEIVKTMNGKIWVTSAQGQGSTFCFYLPNTI